MRVAGRSGGLQGFYSLGLRRRQLAQAVNGRSEALRLLGVEGRRYDDSDLGSKAPSRLRGSRKGGKHGSP